MKTPPKRTSFTSIQHTSGISAHGYRVMPLTTGYEEMVTHRVDDIFATTAKQKGTVTKISNRAITVTYEDGSTKTVALGRQFGDAAGTTFAHELVSNLKQGDKVDYGDAIAYNADYFTPTFHNPRRVAWKAGALVTTALCENPDTHEDASIISEKVSRLLTSRSTKVRAITIPFDHAVSQLVNIGDKVDTESILCTIEDAVTAENKLFTEETLDTLRALSANTPRAKYPGVVEKIEVFYNGDMEDMSPSVRALAQQGDLELARQRKAEGKSVVTGSIQDGMRINGNPLDLDTLAIRVYITKDTPVTQGDKGVFGNQLKTVFSRVMKGVNQSESGRDIDAIFGYVSISNRIVNSPMLWGTTNTLLLEASRRVVAAFNE